MDRTEFLRSRKTGIGGSDVAACLGLNPWKTPLQVWQKKLEEDVTDEQSQAAHFGQILEDIVAKEFQERTGLKVQRITKSIRCGENGWQIANIDRAVINPEIAGRVRIIDDENEIRETGRRITTDAILECKTANQFVQGLWGDTQEFEIKRGEIVTEHQIPLYYETQCQWYMGVTGASICYLAVLIGGQDFRIYCIKRNDEVIEALTKSCYEFWHEFVLKNIPPQPINIEDVKRLYKIDNGTMLEATNDQAVDIGELRTIQEKIKSLEKQSEVLKQRLALSIGESTGLTLGGQKAVTFKQQTRTSFDSTALKKADPKVWQQYKKESSTRILRVF